MFRIAAVVWIMLAVVLAGASLLVIITVPAFSDRASFLIPVVCTAALVVAMPLSYFVARRISSASAG